MTEQSSRLAAYAVCVHNDQILLARWVSQDGTDRHWTLPGGKVEHGEDPFEAVVREVAEETGYVVEVVELLGVDSRMPQASHHNVGIYYRVGRALANSREWPNWLPGDEFRAIRDRSRAGQQAAR